MASDLERLCSLAWEGTDLPTFRNLLRQFPSLANEKSARGQTPLYCAARNGHALFVKELLRIPDINLNQGVTGLGSTPLHGVKKLADHSHILSC